MAWPNREDDRVPSISTPSQVGYISRTIYSRLTHPLSLSSSYTHLHTLLESLLRTTSPNPHPSPPYPSSTMARITASTLRSLVASGNKLSTTVRASAIHQVSASVVAVFPAVVPGERTLTLRTSLPTRCPLQTSTDSPTIPSLRIRDCIVFKPLTIKGAKLQSEFCPGCRPVLPGRRVVVVLELTRRCWIRASRVPGCRCDLWVSPSPLCDCH